jgi:hypothetical protein
MSPRRLLSLAAVLVGGLTTPTAASAAVVGADTDVTWGISRTDMDRTLTATTDAGMKWIRQSISWADGEFDGKGKYNTWWFPEWDAAVDKARTRGLNVALIIDGTPCWASADPNKSCSGTWSDYRWNRAYKPGNVQDYADFVRYVVNRYKAKGVHTYEIWNEPNNPAFWPSGPSAADYLPLLRAGYQAVKAADPGATVLMGGLSSNDWRYLEQLYAAGGGPYFDALNVHPYTLSVDPDSCWAEPGMPTRKAVGAFCGIEEVRNVANANGDSAKPVWITEFGWSNGTCSWCVSSTQQADYLVRAMRKVDTSYPWVPVQLIYALRDDFSLGADANNWMANLGLLRLDFTHKPAYDAVKAYATGTTTTTTTAPPPPPPPAPTGGKKKPRG